MQNSRLLWEPDLLLPATEFLLTDTKAVLVETFCSIPFTSEKAELPQQETPWKLTAGEPAFILETNFSSIIGANWVFIRLASCPVSVLFLLWALVSLDSGVACLNYANAAGLDMWTCRRRKPKFCTQTWVFCRCCMGPAAQPTVVNHVLSFPLWLTLLLNSKLSLSFLARGCAHGLWQSTIKTPISESWLLSPVRKSITLQQNANLLTANCTFLAVQLQGIAGKRNSFPLSVCESSSVSHSTGCIICETWWKMKMGCPWYKN